MDQVALPGRTMEIGNLPTHKGYRLGIRCKIMKEIEKVCFSFRIYQTTMRKLL